MKIRFWMILCWCCLWTVPLTVIANSSAELIEPFPSGQINWTNGVVTAKGVAVPQTNTHEADDIGELVSERAKQQATYNVIDTLMRLRVDNQRCALNLFQAHWEALPKVEEMAKAAKILHIDKDPSGREEIHMQMSLYGGFAQLMLPVEIRQVEPIKPLNGQSNRHNFHNTGINGTDAVIEQDAYTGLIVDARGTGAKPSMVPVLLDEKGLVIFGPAYVSREFAVQHGICQYIRLVGDQWPKWPRVAPKPLLVKGLRTDRPGSCNIVISNSDVSTLRGASSHVAFLKQCRVVIVLD
jgi:hypothetical protein